MGVGSEVSKREISFAYELRPVDNAYRSELTMKLSEGRKLRGNDAVRIVPGTVSPQTWTVTLVIKLR